MSSGTDSQIQQALDLHRAGQLGDAEKIYREILLQHPQHPRALHYLGVIALQVGKLEAAIQLLEQSVQLSPEVEAAGNLAVAYRTAGRLSDAKALLKQVVNSAPHFADAWANLAQVLHAMNELSDASAAATRALGLSPNHVTALTAQASIAAQKGDIDDAIQILERVASLQPTHAQALTQLGLLLKQRKSYDRAIRMLRQALQSSPHFAEAHGHLASTLAMKEDFDSAIFHAEKAVELAPNVPAAHQTLADVYIAAERYQEAAAAARKAVQLDPKFLGGYGILSVALDRQDDVNGSIAALETARGLAPDHREVLTNLGRAYSRAKRHEEALRTFECLLALEPTSPEAHGGLSMALLAMGDWKRGFQEYEWRWRCDSFTTAPREFDRPLWQGSDPTGRTILVHSEQGYGDVIQFARYLPRLVNAGAKVIVECPVQLRELIENIPGVAKVIPLGLKHPDFDLHLPLLSLPRAFGTTADTIPSSVPYLFADEARATHFREIMQGIGEGKKVGLMWAGNRKPDPKRTCPFKELHLLADIPGVQFISLQKDEPAKDLQSAPAGMKIFDIASQLKNFADTAAVIANLDLLISIDTACCHLGGAMGAKTWTLLPFIADWRWLSDRADSPWYPTMRLFRQQRPNNWSDVIVQVRDALLQFAQAR